MKLKILSLAILLCVSGCDNLFQPEEIKEAQAGVRARLKGETSFKFTDVKFYKLTNTVCGKVDSKNKDGADVGVRKFVASRGGVLLETPQTNSSVSVSSDVQTIPEEKKKKKVHVLNYAFDLLDSSLCLGEK